MTEQILDDALRTEVDGLGSVDIPARAYWGASTQRAKDNFDVSGQPIGTLRSLVWALGAVKKAAARANQQQHVISVEVGRAIENASQEVMDGFFDEHFVVDRIQGGAGTSTNMNANEVIANRATELSRDKNPDATAISALDEVNRSQSTNDVYPTAVKLALINDLGNLKQQYTALAGAFVEKASEFSSILKVGRTQLQDAVPMTLGQEFAAFGSMMTQEAKAIDVLIPELLETNLGGTAIGTGITATETYRTVVVQALRQITGLEFYTAEDLVKATSDTGPLLSTSATLRQTAIKLSKIASDMRLLSSGPQTGLAEITLPAVQPGSSIMPGKVNPVIPEMVNQVAFKIVGIDTAIAMAAEAGQLQLNAFEPVMTDGLLEGINLLTQACKILRTRCITGIQANTTVLADRMDESVSIVTALTPVIGYMAASEIAQETLQHGGNVVDKVVARGLADRKQLETLISVQALTGIPQNDVGA